MFRPLTKRQRAGAVQDASRVRKSFKCPTGLGVRRPSAAFPRDIPVSVLTENGSQKLETPYVVSYKLLETLRELRERKEFAFAGFNFCEAPGEDFFVPAHCLQPFNKGHALNSQSLNHD